VDTHVGHLGRLLGREDADRRGDVDVDAVADRGDGLAQLLHELGVRPAHGGDDAELAGARVAGQLGRADQLGHVEPHRTHRRGELPRLRAEVAVLGAAARFEADDALDLDVRPHEPHPHLVRDGEQLVELVVTGLQDLHDLVIGQPLAALEDLLARHVEDVGVHCLCRHDRDSSVCRARSLPAVGPEPLSGVS
jgi:hypothetical protein